MAILEVPEHSSVVGAKARRQIIQTTSEKPAQFSCRLRLSSGWKTRRQANGHVGSTLEVDRIDADEPVLADWEEKRIDLAIAVKEQTLWLSSRVPLRLAHAIKNRKLHHAFFRFLMMPCSSSASGAYDDQAHRVQARCDQIMDF